MSGARHGENAVLIVPTGRRVPVVVVVGFEDSVFNFFKDALLRNVSSQTQTQ